MRGQHRAKKFPRPRQQVQQQIEAPLLGLNAPMLSSLLASTVQLLGEFAELCGPFSSVMKTLRDELVSNTCL